ncbi:MAG: glucose 1-dehydrogenase [Azospirillaceae bacterium]
MAGRLGGKVALITGAGSGFGEGIAERFAAEGAKVSVVDLDADKATAVAERIGGLSIAADVANTAQCRGMIDHTVKKFGGLDILVNNAGFAYPNKPMAEVTEAEYDRVFAVNVKAVFVACQHAAPLIARRGGGSIINTASTAALRPRPGLTWYNASKGAVVTATKSMALEYAGDNIRVNALCPVLGQTGLTRTFLGDDSPERLESFMKTIPLGRMSMPRDIANAALFLASDEAAFITGVALEIDGGRCV